MGGHGARLIVVPQRLALLRVITRSEWDTPASLCMRMPHVVERGSVLLVKVSQLIFQLTTCSNRLCQAQAICPGATNA